MNLKHNLSKSPENRAYRAAKNRCLNPKAERYEDYGGRGIEFRFSSFEEFYKHLGPRPSLDHSLDRRDNNGHYEADNVRWATRSEQGLNKRKYEHKVRRKAKGYSKVLYGWRASIRIHGKPVNLGTFKTQVEAANAYSKALKGV